MLTELAGDRLLTLSEISALSGYREHRIRYLIKTRRIPAAQRAGNCRLFSPVVAAGIIRAADAIELAEMPIDAQMPIGEVNLQTME